MLANLFSGDIHPKTIRINQKMPVGVGTQNASQNFISIY